MKNQNILSNVPVGIISDNPDSVITLASGFATNNKLPFGNTQINLFVEPIKINKKNKALFTRAKTEYDAITNKAFTQDIPVFNVVNSTKNADLKIQINTTYRKIKGKVQALILVKWKTSGKEENLRDRALVIMRNKNIPMSRVNIGDNKKGKYHIIKTPGQILMAKAFLTMCCYFFIFKSAIAMK